MRDAYYNENDEFAAAWLKNIIAAGLIAPGDVDTRSIVDVSGDDLAGYGQCHFFAGIGVWSYALRCAGWRDDRHVWTGSCPCGPFSGAGKKLAFDDPRHLWPEFFRLIAERNPRVVLGEQVASPPGLAWVDLVQSDMEGKGYAFAALDLCAAGVGAPHIRQRLYWVADANFVAGGQGRPHLGGITSRGDAQSWPGPWIDRSPRIVVDDVGAGLEGYAGDGDDAAGWPLAHRSIAEAGAARILADADGGDAGAEGLQRGGQQRLIAQDGGIGHNSRSRPLDGFWRSADWLFCRDGKWRPVEPGTFPLAHGASARVGRLRGYGNALVAPLAQAFIEAVMEVVP